MANPDRPPLTRAVVLRGAGFTIAIALGAVAVWLIVTGTTQKRLEIGVLAGLWGVLLAAYAMFGSRRLGHGADEQVSVASAAGASGGVALRNSGEVERAAEAEERRAFEQRLEAMLRREINTTMTREVADLRDEIGQLRQDMLEKVGGQLRLERIETTRLIGSDLEALQHEVRKLKVATESTPLGDQAVRQSTERSQRTSVRQVVEPAQTRPVSRSTAEVEADVQPARTGAPVQSVATKGDDLAAAAARRQAVEQAQREQAQREQTEREKAQRERAEREKAQREQAEREKAQREQAAREKAQREQAAREKAQREQAARVTAQREQAERERAARAAAAREAEKRAAEQRAAQERAAENRAAAQREVQRREAERQAAARAEERRRTEARAAALRTAEAQQAQRREAEREAAAAEAARAARHSAQPALASESTGPLNQPRWRDAAPAESAEQAGHGVEAPATQPTGTWPRPALSDDPFASLPRITPFTDFELDPIEPSTNGTGATVPEPPPSAYTGRRRRVGGDDPDIADLPDNGRHSSSDERAQDTGRGRRRRHDGDENDSGVDLLASLLDREGVEG